MMIQNGPKIQETITVERISDLRAFLSLEAEWEALLKASSEEKVYLSHRWIAGWLRFFGQEKDLWILVVKERGRLVGAAPLVRSVQSWHGLPVRILHFPISFESSNLRCDFILSERREEAALAIARYLEEHSGDWDRWELSGLPAESPALLPLRRFLQRSSFHAAPWQPQHEYYHLPTSGSFDAYLDKKSRRFRKTLRNHENRLSNAGVVGHRTLKSREEVKSGFALLLDLEARSSKANQIGMIRLEGAIRRFYGYLAEAFGKCGDAQIDLLEIDGVAVAALFSLRREGSLFLLYTCYDPSLSELSPGLLLFRKVLENAWSQGVADVDFNGWTPNVQIWAGAHRSFLKGNLYNRALRSRLVRFWEWTASLRRRFRRADVGIDGLSSISFQEKDRFSPNHSQKDSPEEFQG